MRHAGARGTDTARGAGALTRRAGQGRQRGTQAGGIDTARMPGASTQHAEAGALAHRAGLGASTRHTGAGALTQRAGVFTRHAGVSTQHTGAAGVDAGQGCSQGEGRWQHEPLRLALGAREGVALAA